MIIQPARRIAGQLRLPGDKSISHRAAIISALADGRSRIENFSTSEDCAATLACLRRLGVSIERDGNTVTIEGVGLSGLRAPMEALDCGNSGSTMRMLAGALAGHKFASTLTGDASLRTRPMRRIIAPLEQMGARVQSEEGRAPLRISGRHPLTPIIYEMPVASAQLKSCVLLAGLNADGRTGVVENITTRDHTERMLRWFGVGVDRATARRDDGETQTNITLEGHTQPRAREVFIPGDISSAAFFIVAAALLPDSNLRLENIGLNRTRAELINTLQSLGVNVKTTEVREQCNEEIGDIQVNGTRHGLAPATTHGTAVNVLRGGLIAQLIDELPVLAVLGTQIEGGLEIRDAAELRIKETDRIGACVANLRRMGAEVWEHEDGLTIGDQVRLRGAKLEAYGDHRIAMAFTIAALIAEGESEITGAECVGVSFPEFFALLETVIER
ncbi:MAG: 3-phosphoshikimate 1-carboxyvinyltransferase [Pyrinomonadaceae bacterium]